MTQERIDIVVREDGSRVVRRNLEDIGKTGSDSAREIDKLKKSLGMLALFGGLALLSKEAINLADQYSNLSSRLSLVTTSTQQLTEAQEGLFDISQRTRVGLEGTVDLYGRLSQATETLGKTSAEVMRVTETVNKTLIISGASAASAQAALMQLGQGLGSGTLRGEELNSVLEQTPRLAKAIAEGMGVGIGELRKLGEEGKLTGQAVFQALEKAGTKVSQEFDKMKMTVGQANTVISNSLLRAVGELDKATGATAALASAMVALSGAIDSVGKVIAEHQTLFLVIGGALAGAAVVGGVLALAPALSAVGAAVAGLGAALLANPVVLALLGLGAVTGAVMSLGGPNTGSEQSLTYEIDHLTKRIQEAEATVRATKDDRLTVDLRNRIDAMKAEKDRLQLLRADKVAGSLGPQGEDRRFAESAKNYAEREAAAKALAGVKDHLNKLDSKYVSNMTAIINARQMGLLSDKEYLDLLKEMEKQGIKKTEVDKSAKQAAEANAKRVKELTGTLDEKIAAGNLELQTQGEMTQAQQYALSVMEQLRTGAIVLTAAEKERTAAKLEQIAANEKEMEVLQHVKQQREQDWNNVNTLRESNDQLRQEIELIGADKLAQEAIQKARLDSAISMKEAVLAGLELQVATGQGTAAIKDQILALKEHISLLKDRRRLVGEKVAAELQEEYNGDAAKAAKDANNTLATGIEQGIMDGFRRGNAFRDIFINELKAQFAKTVLRPVISPVADAGNNLLKTIMQAGLQYFTGVKYQGTSGDVTAPNYENAMDQGWTLDSLPQLATGTNYVPYDGMPAVLHQGEAVVPARYNPAAGGANPNTGAVSIVFSPSISVDSRSDRAAVMQNVQDVVAENNKQLIESLKEHGVIR